jgi:hypothetical protein
MDLGRQWRALDKVPVVRTALCLLGGLLLLITPLIGVLPGPGGLITFGAGAALLLKYSSWAKRRYVRLKRRHPKKGAWADWSLRRCSARRREERRKRLEAKLAAEAARERELSRVGRADGEAELVLLKHQIGAVCYFVERRFIPEGRQAREPYWAAVEFSGLYADVEHARADGLRALERA